MWALRPSYYDNDMPIDLRKKVVLEREAKKEESHGTENDFTPKDYSLNGYRERPPPPPALLPVGNLYPFMSERYGVRCSLVSSEENSRERTPQDLRPGSRGSLELAIRKLHCNSKLRKAAQSTREQRCRSTDAVLDNRDKREFGRKPSSRSYSCPDLSKLKSSQSRPNLSFENNGTFEHKSNSAYNNSATNDDRVSSPVIGGAKKRKSFIPIYGDRAPSPRKRPKSPTENPPYDEYYSHPEILLRRQLQQHNPSPYLLHVYDYYQHLVQRLREHSPTPTRFHAPVSPIPTDDEITSDAQRKRPCRALTGKHVRQGTGASLSTLLTLRQKIQERQKAREHQPRTVVNGTTSKTTSCIKKCNNKKSKQITKTSVNKLHNC